MLAYVARRLLLIIPTLFGIMVINFVIVQAAPGGPVELLIARIKGTAVEATSRLGSAGGETAGAAPGGASQSSSVSSKYRGARGLDPEFVRQLEKLYGFDKPAYVRFVQMMERYAMFDFGQSFFRDRSVIKLIVDRLPVSISLGLWTTLLIYLVCIPLGIAKAVRDGSAFDVWTSAVVIVGYAIPGFLFAILLIVLLAGGSFVQWFPLRGLVAPDWHQLAWPARIADYFWHITLPVLSMVIGGFAGLTLLTKNSFLDQIGQQYVLTARAKGLSERHVLYRHVFRNAMLIVISGFPAALISILFTGALLTEVIFSIDGIGLLGFQAAVTRDYPVMFGTLYCFTLLGLVMKLLEDLTYVLVDPRIDFERRGT